MSLGATAVVAVALVAAGVAVLLSLRANLTGQAQSQADDTARSIALKVASRGADANRYARLRLPQDAPVQVTTEDGRLLAVSGGLERISGTGVTAVRAVPVPVATPAPTPTPTPTPSAVPGRTAESGDDHGGDGDDGGHGRGRGRGGRDDESRGGEDGDRHGGGTASPAAGDDPVVGDIGRTVAHGTGRATLDGRTADYRFATVKATDLAGQTVLIHAGASLAARESAVKTAAAAMLAGLPVLLLVVGGATWRVTRRALAPVEGIRREMAAITASEDLSRRVPEPAARDEVALLARTTNETLTALEAAVERQRRFVADASHELRSPIASLRTQLEVGSAHPHLLDVPGAVKDTERLQHLAGDLLLLARLDAGERPARRRVDLGELAREEVRRRPADQVPVTVDVEPLREVAGSRGQLARVVGNLVDNAQRHARAAVTVTVRLRDGLVVLAVGDDGAGVPPAERARIFERFVRLDDARSRDEGGAGLGLAIARDVAHRHDGTLTVGTAPAGGALFELRLPPAAGD
ncbi:HAMP domain-containing histidine kinase [Actinacidiphila glaucinigra]|uniref:sensor histidine kinase n=1 Tax=Actinacidiphila glaucinigra TaxID=235986 RepID=UPI002DD98448|nr:HAMP domain-containing sensor histidine kinase [Actinacidiphila glaucinigra]WSD65450.1 HAMP domain-containing histidine kinase [Actinacidiphila glaucinigra]